MADAPNLTATTDRFVSGADDRLRSDFQPLLAHAGILAQILRRALEHDPAMPHDVETTRDGERNRELLLDQQDGYTACGDLLEQPAHTLDNLRRKALRRLVDHDQRRIAHQRA